MRWLVGQWVGGSVSGLAGWSVGWWVCEWAGWLVSGLVGL